MLRNDGVVFFEARFVGFHGSFNLAHFLIDAGDAKYNYGTTPLYGPELPGISVFFRDDKGSVFHTYSTFARGLDMMNAAYHYIDLTPLGSVNPLTRIRLIAL